MNPSPESHLPRPGDDRTLVCVFCAARDGLDPVWREEAGRFGRLLARRGLGLVYGGGGKGLMGAVADGALEGGGRVVGVIPSMLVEKERAHAGVTDMRIVSTMLERKTLMIGLAHVFVALPGGLGTLDELFEVLTWTQLGLAQKRSAIWNVRGCYDPIREWLDRAVADGFIRPDSPALPIFDTDPERLLDRLLA